MKQEAVGVVALALSEQLERFSVDVNRNSKGVPKSAQIRFGLL
jgi:N-formylglutamate amidohydrolase